MMNEKLRVGQIIALQNVLRLTKKDDEHLDQQRERWLDCELRSQTEGRLGGGAVTGQYKTGRGQDRTEQDVQDGICQDMTEEDRTRTRAEQWKTEKNKMGQGRMANVLLCCAIL